MYNTQRPLSGPALSDPFEICPLELVAFAQSSSFTALVPTPHKQPLHSVQQAACWGWTALQGGGAGCR